MLPQIIAAAVVGALSPAAALAAIMLLGSRRPVANTLACFAGWTVVLVAVAGLLLAVLGDGAGTSGKSAKAAVGLVVGLLLVGVAVRSFIGARHPVVRLADEGREAPVEMPAWMQRVEHLGPGGAFVFGMILIAVSPADLAAYFSAVQALLGSDEPNGTRLAILVLLIVGISSCILIPLLVYVALPRRADALLASGKTWIVAHQRAVNGGAAGIFGVLLVVNSVVSAPG